MKRVLLFWLVLMASPSASAAIYRCVAAQGAVTYQDLPCVASHPENRSLPLVVNKKSQQRQAEQRAAARAKTQQARKAEIALRRQQRALQQAQRAKTAAEKQAAWRAKCCEQARMHKADIQAVLRRGYRAAAEPHLRTRLKNSEDRERRYCQTPRHH